MAHKSSCVVWLVGTHERVEVRMHSTCHLTVTLRTFLLNLRMIESFWADERTSGPSMAMSINQLRFCSVSRLLIRDKAWLFRIPIQSVRRILKTISGHSYSLAANSYCQFRRWFNKPDRRKLPQLHKLHFLISPITYLKYIPLLSPIAYLICIEPMLIENLSCQPVTTQTTKPGTFLGLKNIPCPRFYPFHVRGGHSGEGTGVCAVAPSTVPAHPPQDLLEFL